MRHNLSICAVFRDEAKFLDEWLTFHSQVGVEHFYLFDDNSSDNFQEVLDPWIRAGRVELYESRGRSQQKVYQRCLNISRFRTQWLAFIDIDEFLWSPKHGNLLEPLQAFTNSAAVVVRWVMFGSSGKQKMSWQSVIEDFTMCLPADSPVDLDEELRRTYVPSNERITGAVFQGKSIVNPLRVLRMWTHWPLNHIGPLLNEKRVLFGAPEKTNPRLRMEFFKKTPVEVFRINHYWSKSLEDLEKKVSRRVNGSFHSNKKLDQATLFEKSKKRDAVFNLETDSEILSVWKSAKENRERFLSAT